MNRFLALFISFVLSFYSCGESKKDRIQRLVWEKLEEEQIRLKEQCRIELIGQANQAVDSVIISMAIADTTIRIERPTKPDIPQVELEINETINPNPLFDTVQTGNIQKENQ
ncbi:MAG: hypothetical protein KJP00_15935 [Bacteroidia bacterium]|nr:hypothetical protein [Bacteroidia bacterium]